MFPSDIERLSNQAREFTFQKSIDIYPLVSLLSNTTWSLAYWTCVCTIFPFGRWAHCKFEHIYIHTHIFIHKHTVKTCRWSIYMYVYHPAWTPQNSKMQQNFPLPNTKHKCIHSQTHVYIYIYTHTNTCINRLPRTPSTSSSTQTSAWRFFSA
jgi:hypothetical protein